MPRTQLQRWAIAERCQIGVDIAKNPARLAGAAADELELAIDFITEALEPYDRDPATGSFFVRGLDGDDVAIPPGTAATLKELYAVLRKLEEELLLKRASRGSA